MGLGRVFTANMQVFTANMTGNVALLGFALAGVPGLSIARSLVALAAFLAGAVIGGRLGGQLAGSRRRWLVAAALVEATLVFAAALLARGYDGERLVPVAHLYALIALTAPAMGVRNATVRRLAVPDQTTTVLTLTLTGLGADSRLAGGTGPRWQRRVDLGGRHVGWRHPGRCAGAATGTHVVPTAHWDDHADGPLAYVAQPAAGEEG